MSVKWFTTVMDGNDYGYGLGKDLKINTLCKYW